MHRASESIGRIATALAKAQSELNNPERTLTGTISVREGERLFRYASLANGLELVRKCLGQHEIAVVQTTAVDQGQILLTTLLAHSSGEWVSSIWPVCQAAEPSAQVKGAALTYARRYALFTIVGIAGEDDLDAPDLIKSAELPPPDQPPRKQNGGALHSPRASFPSDRSAIERDRLLDQLTALESEEALAMWAQRALPIKNALNREDARAIEAAYLRRISQFAGRAISDPEMLQAVPAPGQSTNTDPIRDESTSVSIAKPERKRSKAHLAFVASQPCLICQGSPCDAHHVKIAKPHSLGRKVSDEFTVPLCRPHHQELHRQGNERAWWANLKIAPLPIAKALWEKSPVHGVPTSLPQQINQQTL